MTTESQMVWRSNVRDEIKAWVTDVLSIPSEHFSGLAPCPFAKGCVSRGMLDIDFGDDATVLDRCENWDDRFDLVIIVTEDWDHAVITDWCEATNGDLAGMDLALMAFVPGEGPGTCQPDEESEDWDYLVDDEYSMVFIQRLSQVNESSRVLDRQGYYRNCSAEFLEYVKDRRERLDNHAR